jgi:hypothetical protein
MNHPEIPTLALEDLLKKRKYRNFGNLSAAHVKYYISKQGLFDFGADIKDAATSTMAFRLVQSKLNFIRIEQTCLSHVFPDRHSPNEDGRLNKYLSILYGQRENIVSRYALVSDCLDYPPEKTAQRFIADMERWKGYKTYGDYEGLLAGYLSPFCNKTDFLECIDYLTRYIDRNPRQGLSDAIRTVHEEQFYKLEQFIESHKKMLTCLLQGMA